MTENRYTKFTPKMALLLAAPHTWPASVFPVLLGTTFALALGAEFDCTFILLIIDVLCISILMQSAVNTFNDYRDFAKGSDSEDDDVDPSDAVLVYNNVNPKSALKLSIAFVVIAFILGIYCIYEAGWIPLAIAIVGAVAVFLYSGGKTPISYLPIGEAVSGIVMGGLITLAVTTVLTRQFDIIVLLWSLPLIIGIALMMMTNNGCDIDKDIEAGRRTLPVLLGHERTHAVYHASIYAWYIAYIAIVGFFFTSGLIIVPFAILATYPLSRALMANPLVGNTRKAAMSQVLSLEIALGAFFCASVLAGIAI